MAGGESTLSVVARQGRQPGDEMRPTHALKRGDWLKPESEVTPGVPAILHPLPAGPNTSRLTFARWLVDRKSPTAARVFVNGLWQAYFGIGIVETSEDLGVQSPAPSHPELLDWLATEFMDSGWDIKAMHRLIVKSATYRQSSRISPELYAKDPYNRLLARGPACGWMPNWCGMSRSPPAAAASGVGRPQCLCPCPGLPVSAAGQLRPEDLE